MLHEVLSLVRLVIAGERQRQDLILLDLLVECDRDEVVQLFERLDVGADDDHLGLALEHGVADQLDDRGELLVDLEERKND